MAMVAPITTIVYVLANERKRKSRRKKNKIK
jgi:hypothetical protein